MPLPCGRGQQGVESVKELEVANCAGGGGRAEPVKKVGELTVRHGHLQREWLVSGV